MTKIDEGLTNVWITTYTHLRMQCISNSKHTHTHTVYVVRQLLQLKKQGYPDANCHSPPHKSPSGAYAQQSRLHSPLSTHPHHFFSCIENVEQVCPIALYPSVFLPCTLFTMSSLFLQLAFCFVAVFLLHCHASAPPFCNGLDCPRFSLTALLCSSNSASGTTLHTPMR